MDAKLKIRLHSYAHFTGISTLLARCQRVTRILMYHGVGGEECPAAAFESHMVYLAKYFDVVPLDVVVARLQNRQQASGREVVLTFDDGLRNCCTVAYPILKRLGLPATFFVCPALIEERRWLWTHEARQRLKRLDDGARLELSGSFGCELKSIEQVMEWMKTLSKVDRQAVEQGIRRRTRFFQPLAQENQDFDVMTWQELASLSPEIITIGAHTANHDIMSSLEERSLFQEVEGCRYVLEAKLQRPVEFFCYPNGIYNNAVVQRVRSAYRAAVTTKPGFVKCGDDPHSMGRIEAVPDPSFFTWRLHRPSS